MRSTRILTATLLVLALFPALAHAASWQTARASWYCTHDNGSRTASGWPLRESGPQSLIFAHRSMKMCDRRGRGGTRVQFSYRGRTVTAVCSDRGPYIGGRTFDLGPGVAKALRFSGVGTVKWRIVR
jgi:rare lipoprotein A (peptidoglycan hydrolase)